MLRTVNEHSCGLPYFRGRHPSLLLSQSIQPFQRVIDVILSQYLLQEFFWENLSQERLIYVR